MRNALRAIAAVALGGLLLAGCSPRVPEAEPTPSRPARATVTVTPTPPTASTPAPTATRWRSCAGKFDCTDIEVPLDYSGATSASVSVAVWRWPAGDQAHRIGVLLIDPGGPGGSGIEYLQGAGVQSWAQLHQRFDIVAFDPRGVGASTAVDCVDSLDDYFKVATPHTPDEEVRLVANTRAFAAACNARSGRLLPFLSAESVARDMDRIRAALGEEKISYLGLSYGTYLGAMYADLFPNRVRAFALDGPVDPKLPAKEWQKQQALGFEVAFTAFATDCTSNPTCALAKTPGGAAGAYDSLIAGLVAKPLAVGDRTLGPSEGEVGVMAALYSRSAWPRLASAISSALGGNGSALLTLFDGYAGRNADGTYDDFTEVYRAISCVDLAFPRTVAEYDQWAADFKTVAPRFGAGLAYEHIDCAFWAAPPVAPRNITGAGAPPILVIGTTRDPATPIAWAVALSEELESGMLLKVDGDGHTAYGKNGCATSLVTTYLLNLKAPPKAFTCPA